MTNGGEHTQCGEAGRRDDSHPGGAEQDRVRFHHTTQNSKQFKTCALFISGIFYLIFLDHDWG